MFQVPAIVMGMIGSAFMVASFAPSAAGDAVGGDRALAAVSQIAVATGKIRPHGSTGSGRRKEERIGR